MKELFMYLFTIAVVLFIIFGIPYLIAVSDLPDWFKWFLLK